MKLIQFNVYFNHHFHIFMLNYIMRYLHLHKSNNSAPIRTYVSANNITTVKNEQRKTVNFLGCTFTSKSNAYGCTTDAVR